MLRGMHRGLHVSTHPGMYQGKHVSLQELLSRHFWKQPNKLRSKLLRKSRQWTVHLPTHVGSQGSKQPFWVTFNYYEQEGITNLKSNKKNQAAGYSCFSLMAIRCSRGWPWFRGKKNVNMLKQIARGNCKAHDTFRTIPSTLAARA